MTTASVSTVLPVPIGRVWTVLGSFHSIDRWVGRVGESRPLDAAGPTGVGSVRRLTMTDGSVVDERLVAYDARTHSMSYDFPAHCPFPAHCMVFTVGLCPVTELGHTFVCWSVAFDAHPGRGPQVAAVCESLFREFLADLEHTVLEFTPARNP